MNKLILLLLLFISFGCNNESKIVADADCCAKKLKSAPSLSVPKENLPEWLVDELNKMERWLPHRAKIFKGEWNRQTIYFITYSHQRCLYDDIYYENGEKIVWAFDNPVAVDDFCASSKNWVLIYEYGEGLLFFEL